MERPTHCTDLPPSWFTTAFPADEDEMLESEPLPLGIW